MIHTLLPLIVFPCQQFQQSCKCSFIKVFCDSLYCNTDWVENHSLPSGSWLPAASSFLSVQILAAEFVHNYYR